MDASFLSELRTDESDELATRGARRSSHTRSQPQQGLAGRERTSPMLQLDWQARRAIVKRPSWRAKFQRSRRFGEPLIVKYASSAI